MAQATKTRPSNPVYQVALLSEIGCHTVQEFDNDSHPFGAVKGIAERFNVAWRPVAQTVHIVRNSNRRVAWLKLNNELQLEIRYLGERAEPGEAC